MDRRPPTARGRDPAGATRPSSLLGPRCAASRGSPGAMLAAGCRLEGAKPLSPIFQNWIVTLHPEIEHGVNVDFARDRALAPVIAPPGGVDMADFLQEAKIRTSTWDVYVGMTPWVEMARLVDKRSIQPWDAYIEPDVIGDIVPRVRAEGTMDGRLYSWPFLLDVDVQGWNGELVERAGLEPDAVSRELGRVHRQRPSGGEVRRGSVSDAPSILAAGGRSFRSPTASGRRARTRRRALRLPPSRDRGGARDHAAHGRAVDPDVLEPEAVLASVSPDEARSPHRPSPTTSSTTTPTCGTRTAGPTRPGCISRPAGERRLWAAPSTGRRASRSSATGRTKARRCGLCERLDARRSGSGGALSEQGATQRGSLRHFVALPAW